MLVELGLTHAIQRTRLCKPLTRNNKTRANNDHTHTSEALGVPSPCSVEKEAADPRVRMAHSSLGGRVLGSCG